MFNMSTCVHVQHVKPFTKEHKSDVDFVKEVLHFEFVLKIDDGVVSIFVSKLARYTSAPFNWHLGWYVQFYA